MSSDRSHPFLIVRREDYSALERRAHESPWREMRAQALADTALTFDPTASVRIRGVRLSRILSTTTLAYLVDPNHRSAHRDRIIEHLRYWDPAVTGNLSIELRRGDPGDWERITPVAGAFFQAVLALDIIHDDLDSSHRDTIEAWLEAGPGSYFRADASRWKSSGLAARGIWALYRGDRATLDSARTAYLAEIHESITPDGVFVEGPGYAIARWLSADREHKHYFGDVLVFAGELPASAWYGDPRLRAFQEWLTGYARTPSGENWIFGDTALGELAVMESDGYPGSERAARFSESAAVFAAKMRGDSQASGRLCAYVLTHQQPPPFTPAPSRIFPDGGAFFRAASDDPAALAGVLWNSRSARGHNHKEVNALGLAAYGQLLLRGAGYEGWAAASHGFSWDYVNSRAFSGNVALIDYEVGDDRNPAIANDHTHKFGLGVLGGVNGCVDWATGDSGTALPNGNHRRTFLMIHPRNGVGGYFVSIDNVACTSGTGSPQLVWHPNSAAVETITPDESLRWSIGPAPVTITVYLATPPDRCSWHDGLFADWSGTFVGRALAVHYVPGAIGRRQILTLLQPADSSHPAPRTSRLAGPDWTGARVQFDEDVHDTVIECEGRTSAEPEAGIRLEARVALYRIARGALSFLFVADARGFHASGFLFASDSEVSGIWVGDRFKLTSAGARLTLRQPGLVAARIDDGPATDAEAETLHLTLPAGACTIRLTIAAAEA